MKVLKSDVVSGYLYNKLIQEYKKYDKKQKEYIKNLVNELVLARKEVELLSIPEGSDESLKVTMLKTKAKNQAIEIQNLVRKNEMLLKENAKLLEKLYVYTNNKS